MSRSESSFVESLEQLEAAIQAAGASLADRDPDAVQRQAEVLRQAVLGLADLQARLGQFSLSEATLRRLQVAAAQLAVLREQLVRASVQVNRAVQTLLPEAGGGATYDKVLGRSASALSKAYKG